jgi:tRNA threonylcarbamoyladenosine biosynthesis protein TsaB
MLTLGIDSSGSIAGVALVDHGEVLASVMTGLHLTHSETILLNVQEVLASAGKRPADLECVGVTVGPGSFTGLRVGLGTARGLGVSRWIRIVGIPTMEAISFPLRSREKPVCVVLPSRRGYVYRAILKWEIEAGRWVARRERGEENLPIDRFLSEILPPLLLTGEGLERVRRELEMLALEGIEVIPAAELDLAGAGAAILAEESALRGESFDPGELKPLYVHHQVATLPTNG